MAFYSFQVFKTGVTHWFSIDAARRDLGYEPTKQNDLSDVIEWFKARGRCRKKPKASPFVRLLKDVFLGVVFAVVLMSFLPAVK